MIVRTGLLYLAVTACAPDTPAADPETSLRQHAAAMAAHHLCSGVFVVGRDYRRTPEQVLREDIAAFPVFQWQDDFVYEVDEEAGTATVRGPGVEPRTAKYHGDQGCTILPAGEDEVYYQPVEVPRSLPDPSTQDWPTGDVGATAPVPDEVDRSRLDAALDWAMAQPQSTRALVVAYKGKILGERSAAGFTRNTPQISWSQGKSITSALIGVLVHRGRLAIDDPAPVSEWQQPEDPRRAIQIRHLLNMSSGLDFKNYGLDQQNSWSVKNEHFRIYFDALNVFDHAVHQPPGDSTRLGVPLP